MMIMTGYIYDANGTRVAKAEGSLWRGTITAWSCDPTLNGFKTTDDYILGLSGEQVTEMGMGGATTGSTTSGLVWQHTNVWAAGKLLATYDGGAVNGTVTSPGLHFYFADPLSTRRVQTDYAGNIENSCSSLPFGDGESCAATPTEHLFTGKERDAESGNDYFGARYYGSMMGRFLSPDPLMASAKAWDPQTWNRYTYGRNNPLRMIDPTGMAEVSADACAKDKNCVSVNLHVIWDKHGNQGGELTDKQKAAFIGGQLQDAKDKWGNADIHFNVTFGSGESSDLGLEKGALNVVVTDKGATDVSMMKGGYAVSFVNQNYEHLNTEIGHQFAGDTRGFSNAIMNHLPFGGFGVPDAIADTMNENRLYQADPASMVPHDTLSHFEHYQAVGTINSGARDFQRAITPTTK